jgi:hypothetical protein
VFLLGVKPAVLAVRAGVGRGSEVSCCSHDLIVRSGSEGEKSTEVLFVSVFLRRTKVLWIGDTATPACSILSGGGPWLEIALG